jgi:antitoxin component YwqK of YwqJK toxin-antitoxin module
MKTLYKTSVITTTVLFLFSNIVFSQNDTVKNIFKWKVVNDTNIRNIKSCKPNVYDTLFIVQNDSLILVQLYGKIKSGKKKLAIEYELSKSDMPTNHKDIVYEFYTINYSKYFLSKATTEIVEFSNKFQTGSVKLYDTTGNLTLYFHIRNGILDGIWNQYYTDGKIMVEGKYSKHARSGLWKFYYDNGRIMKTGYYYPDVLIFEIDSQNPFSLVDVFTTNYMLIKKIPLDSIESELKKYPNDRHPSCPKIVSFRDGEWKIWDRDGNLKLTKIYYKEAVKVDDFDLVITKK